MINAGGGSSSGGGGGSDIAGGVTQAWVNQNYVSIEFFRKVFKVWAAGETSSDPDVEIMPNDITTTVKNIQAQAGLWTEAFLSALGQGSGGGTGGATTLDQLDDVVITSPTNGQALIYNATSQMWVNGTIQSGTDMATVWSALAAATNEQINASHLSVVLADYVTTTSLQTILGDYLTQTSADQRYITIAYFDRLFRAYNGNTLVSHNDTTTTIDNIKAMFGFWTDMYLSALGRNSAATGLGLDNLTDVTINTPTDGQVLQYNAASSKWENATIQTVVALSGLTDVTLTSLQNGQTLLYDSTTSKWYNSALKTINGQSLLGSGDISVGGGASGNYLPLSGGTLVGSLFATAGIKVVNICIECDNSGALSHYGSEINNWNDKLYIQHSSSKIVTIANGGGNVGIGTPTPSSDYKLHVIGAGYFTTGLKAADVIIENGNEINHASDLWLNYNSSRLWMCKNGKAIVGTIATTTDLPKFTVIGTSYLQNGAKLTSICIECDNSMGDNAARTGEINTYDSNMYIQHNSSKDLLLCNGGGDVGIGTSPSYKLHVAGTIFASGAITALSDARKKDITGEAGVTVEQIAQAPAVQFLWKDKERRKDGQQVGTLAQYWQTVLPEVVMDKGGELSMQYGVAALVSSIIIARKVANHEFRIGKMEKWMKKWAEENDE